MQSTRRRPPKLLEPLRLLAVALQFLTRIPVPAIDVAAGDLRRASAAFPLVGVVVAAVAIGVRAGVGVVLGPVVGTVAGVVAMVAVTGAFHEDGLADATDGIWGGWDPEQRVTIMRDSRIGTYGTLALVSLIGLRVALLAPVTLEVFVRAVLVGHVLGRGAGLAMAGLLPSIGGGKGADVAGPVKGAGLVLATLTVAAVLVAATDPVTALLIVGICLLPFAATRRLFRRRLGGITGDTLGAVNVIVEVTAMAVVVAVAQRGGW